MFAKLTSQLTGRNVYVNPVWVGDIESTVHGKTIVTMAVSSKQIQVVESPESAHAIISEAMETSLGEK